jgi:hypothetical protein
LPALVFLGVLAGSRIRERPVPPLPGPGLGIRALGLAVLALCLCTIGLSATLPSLASTKASSALVAASTRGSVQHAEQDAALASRLDPLSDAGPRAQTTIALHQFEPARARTYVLDAIRREPNDVQAWLALSVAELGVSDRAGALYAVRRALALDPHGAVAQGVLRSLQQTQQVQRTPPNRSATSFPLGP